MSTPSEKILDDQPLYSPAQAYRELLHQARDADREYVVTGESLREEDFADIQFESYVDDGAAYQDDDYEDIFASAAPSGYRVRFDEEEDLNLEALLGEGDIKWDAPIPELESSRISTASEFADIDENELLEDSYFPGYLDDAVQGKVPSPQRMSLLEAFDKRLEHEKQKIRERLGYSDIESSPQRLARYEDEDVSSPIRDDQIMAAILGFHVDKKIQNKPETELTKAIDSFIKADMIHEYQIKFEVMQKMSKRVVSQLSVTGEGEARGAEPIGKKYPKFHVLDVGDGGRPLEIISYIGSTHSKEEN